MASRRTALVVLAAFALAACGDDGDDQIVAPDDATTTTEATAEPDGGGDLPEACELVPDAAAVSGLPLGEGVPGGDERRRVCAFSATEAGQVGLTIGVEGGARFDEKATRSEESLGVPGEELDGIGDRALFFFADDDIPEGVGGALVEVGDRTVDITLQGLDEDAMRDAAVALAEAAASNL